MADFSNQGVTYSAALSTFAIGADTWGIMKAKPPGVDQEIELGYELGNRMPVTFILGKVNLENMTVAIRAAEWERWADANPLWSQTEYPFSLSLRGRGIDTRTINVPRGMIKKAVPTEVDIGTVSEVVYELEVVPMSPRTGDRPWIQ